MPDGGFRPGYNAQITTATASSIIVGIAVETSSSDAGLLQSALQQAQARYGRLPADCLVDGGFNKNDDIEWAAAQGVAVHCPPVKNKHKTDPFAPRDDDGPGVAAWRIRMASETGKARYKLRNITECVHGRMRQNNLYQITVRGLAKAKTVLLLHALSPQTPSNHAWRPPPAPLAPALARFGRSADRGSQTSPSAAPNLRQTAHTGFLHKLSGRGTAPYRFT